MQNTAFENLLKWLEDAAERQENILAVCISQGEAARTRQMEALEARTAALQLLIQEAAEAEQERATLVKDAAAEAGLTEEVTLSKLIAVAPAEWAARLAQLQKRIGGVLQQTRGVVRENNFVVRRSLRRAEQIIQAIAPAAAPAGYAPQGGRTAHRAMTLNARG